jgi:steroid delta-isomerase-like uncharacterized protein
VADTATKPKRPRRKGAKTIARAYLEAIGRQDIDEAVSYWRPGGIDRLHGFAEMRAPGEIREYFRSLFEAFPDWEFEIVEAVGSGNTAALRWHATATFTGPGKFQGLSATGATIDVEGCDVFVVEDGEIVENNAYTNGAQIAEQLGALPPLDSVSGRAMTGLLNARTAAADALRRFRERR